MLALESKVELRGWESTPLLKVADLAEFATGAFPVERMVFDARGSGLAPAVFDLPWAGFLIDDASEPPANRPTIRLLSDAAIVRAGDVIELRPSTSKVAVRFRRGDNGNVLFATERCNSFCLMCSQPPRQIQDDWRVSQLCELIELVDRDEPSIAISGGEPTLLQDGLVKLVAKCASRLPDTHLHILSNGRRFEDLRFARKFRELHPSLTWGVPLYGDHFELHDYIVQSEGAFSETIRGLYALHSADQRIEVRIVLVKPVVERLGEISRFIYRNLPFVEHVALMGVEPIGFAKANRDAMWIDPADFASDLNDAAEFLALRGIQPSIYNLPLCTLPRTAWKYTKRSISKWKQDYLPACNDCSVRNACGGFFGWVTDEWTSRAISPIFGESLDA